MNKFISIQIHSIFSEVKQSLCLSLPLVASQLAYAVSLFINTSMTGHISREALAAVGLADTVWVLLTAFFLGMLCSIGILVSQYLGMKNNKGIQLVMSQSFLFGLLLTIPVVFTLWYVPIMLRHLGNQDLYVTQLAIRYLHSLIWCLLPLTFLVIAEQFLVGIHKTKLVLYISLLQVPVEVFVNYVFVFGKFGLPKFGVAGFGYGFTLVFTLFSIFIGLFLYKSKSCRNYHIFSDLWKIQPKYLLELLRVGWPIGFMYGIEIGAFSVITLFMSSFGTDALAAHQIARQYFYFILIILGGMLEATAVRVGYAVGSNNRQAIKRIACTDVSIATFFMSVIAILYIGFTRSLVNIDISTSNPEYVILVRQAVNFLKILAILQLFEGVRTIYIAALRGLKDTSVPMFMSFVGFWVVAIPAAYFLGFILNLEGSGLWLGLTIGITVNALILWMRFNKLVERVDLKKLVI